MLGGIARARRNRAVAAAAGKPGTRRIYTWIHVFRCDAEACIPADEAALGALVAAGNYNCIGQSHSYNGVQIVPGVNAMMMREGGLKLLAYDPATGLARVGASVSVKELKQFLMTHERRVFNSGNYMEQTVVGALATGTHGFGPRGVMADALTAVTFLDGAGRRVTVRRGDPDFAHVALSFGTIAPIVEIEMETAPINAFVSTSYVTRLSRLDELRAGTEAVNWAVLPYSNPDDPMMMLHTLTPFALAKRQADQRKPWLSTAGLVRFFLRHYAKFDLLFPAFRRKLERFADRLDIEQREQIQTDPYDLDYLYDPKPGLAAEKPPSILRGMFSTTHTGYNLAFFVPLARAPAVVKFLMLEADALRDLGFYLKGVISVRELTGTSELVFAGNHREPVAAIDLFADPRDYAWLERLQRLVLQYEPATRPHFGKSAMMPEFRASLGEADLERLLAIHRRHYPQGQLMFNERFRAFLDVGSPLPGESAAEAELVAA